VPRNQLITKTVAGPKKPFCVPTDELLRAKDDLLSKGGQSLSRREGEKARKGMGKGKKKGNWRGGRKGEDDLHPTLF